MSRYTGVDILKNSSGKRYFKPVKYPDIPLSDNDIYFISTWGDTLDVVSFDYYKNVDDYWIIAVANGLKGDSRFIPAGMQIRVPQDTLQIKADYNKLNGIS